ncbi:MAG: Gfo/Idh/MocA family oxidoreductase [Clostridia bacterium]|nr:Gfo/Idh/MocA family oxidoreductase [Clostridia bacterium]
MATDTIVRVGFVGCGAIANGKHMPALAKLPNVQMVAFCDIVRERAEASKARFGTPDAKVYEDYRELLEDKSIDVVHVCTPNRSHSFITVDALDAGKHVMCEKPMAINTAEAQKMLDAAKRSGKKLTIGYQCRQTPEVQYLKKEALAGTFGDIYYAKASAVRRRGVPTWGVFIDEYEQGGGPLIDIGTHSLDLTLWIMNNYKPKHCLGQTFHKLNGITEDQGNGWANWDPAKFTVEDSAFGFVVMENGATIYLESSWALNTLEERGGMTMICGTKAGGDNYNGVRINGVRHNQQYTLTPKMTPAGAAFNDAIVTGAPEDVEAAQWINAILEDKDPCVLPEEAFTITRILEGIYISAKTGDIYRF